MNENIYSTGGRIESVDIELPSVGYHQEKKKKEEKKITTITTNGFLLFLISWIFPLQYLPYQYATETFRISHYEED